MTGHTGSIGTIVDLFSGCGGFSLGAELAGFRSLIAVDIDANIQSGYRRNFPNTRAVQASVADITKSDWRQLLGSERPDGIIGGPPCQGFSWIGKKENSDPRNSLLSEFFRHVNLLRPKFFIMENVIGLLHEDKIDFLSHAVALVDSSYSVLEPIVVNASEFGAPTNRRRVIVVGFDPDAMPSLKEGVFAPPHNHQSVTVRDAIADLPTPIPRTRKGDDLTWAKYPSDLEHPLSSYARRMRSSPPNFLGSKVDLSRFCEGWVSGVGETRHSAAIADRYSRILPGSADPITKSQKLDWDRQCPTLRAGTGSEKGAFQAVRPLHPSEGRVISVREAARLQGFPDWFGFHPTTWHSFRMIGNSVSPVVSEALLAAVAAKFSVALAA